MDMNFAIQQGMMAGLTFLVGSAIVAVIPKYKWITAAILLILVTPLAIGGFWFSKGELGISDWDYYFSYHEQLRQSIVDYHQFPLWNAWSCGGTAALGDPEFPVLSPLFLLELAFGIPIGFRLAIFASIATGAVGVLLLGKRLKLTPHAALLAALTVGFGSVNILEIVEGHPNVFSAMWIPWILWAWLAAYRQPLSTKLHKNIWCIITGIFLALTFFQGGVYLLFYTTFAFAILILLTSNKKQAFLITLYSGLWALGFAAIKLLPAVFWLSQFQDEAYASSTNILPYLHEIFLGRHLHGAEEVIPNQGSGWHEYGAYIGIIPIIFAALSVFRSKRNRIVVALLIANGITILLSASGPALEPFFDKVSFIPRSNISRVILFSVISIGLLAGYGFDWLKNIARKKLPKKTITTVGISTAAVFLLGIAAVDLMTLSYQLSQQAFVLPNVYPIPDPAPKPIGHTTFKHEIRYQGIDYTRGYANVPLGFGTINYCSVLGPKPAVRTVHDEENFGPILINKDFTINSINWSPNTVTADITATDKTNVVLNTNYAQSWYANDIQAKEVENRVATQVEAGHHTITFSYKPRGIVVGILLTTVTVVLAVASALSVKKKKG